MIEVRCVRRSLQATQALTSCPTSRAGRDHEFRTFHLVSFLILPFLSLVVQLIYTFESYPSLIYSVDCPWAVAKMETLRDEQAKFYRNMDASIQKSLENVQKSIDLLVNARDTITSCLCAP